MLKYLCLILMTGCATYTYNPGKWMVDRNGAPVYVSEPTTYSSPDQKRLQADRFLSDQLTPYLGESLEDVFASLTAKSVGCKMGRSRGDTARMRCTFPTRNNRYVVGMLWFKDNKLVTFNQ